MTPTTPQEDEPVTDQERWAEQEAKQFDRNARYLREECMPGWLAKAAPEYHPSIMQNAYEIALKAAAYDAMAYQLRQPRYQRIEHETYERCREGQTP